MLDLLDASLESFLRAEVPLRTKDVDIAFEAPDSDWGAGVTKPTINLYLWDIRRNTEDAVTGFELGRDDGGNLVRTTPRPRIDCRYLVTAWTNEIQDEHALLGRVLATLFASRTLPAEHLVGSYNPIRPIPTLTVASADGKDQSDFWSALGGQLKPGLDLVVTATVDSQSTTEPGPPVDRYELDVVDVGRQPTEVASAAELVAGRTNAEQGTRVVSPRGSARISEDGTFAVKASEDDTVYLEGDPSASAVVPEHGPVELTSDRPGEADE